VVHRPRNGLAAKKRSVSSRRTTSKRINAELDLVGLTLAGDLDGHFG
jgi:hypothetical protein